ncbi:MAG: beta-N-acetylglucosaminidase domain-containing protein [Trueperaceae bacterium]|nr:beta-N-acetylglucosaminidase domain-containing protein [Trueperaceae bacterium]
MPLPYRGVIEGFYGRPWRPAQRRELLGDLAAWDMTTYVYGPKDDVKVRAAWRLSYDQEEARELGALAREARTHGVALHYAIAPGLDLRYADPDDRRALRAKVDQVLDFGAEGVTLLFDDIDPALSPADARAFPSPAHAQADVANELHAHLQDRGGVPLLLCPTEYCDRMADPSPEESPYLRTLGEDLHPGIDVYWTGPEIVSERVPPEAAARMGRTLGRKPVLWDNLHANDYDGRRLYLGPYRGRPPELRAQLRGVISNPNVEAEANFVPLHTTAAWLRGHADTPDAAESSFRAAIDAWWPRFATHDGHLDRELLEVLVDYLHLPFAHGPRARAHLDALRVLAADPRTAPPEVAATLARAAEQLRAAYVGVTELTRRELAYALYPYAWDLKEEAEVGARLAQTGTGRLCRPHGLANTYRTGVLDELQGLLPLGRDGCVPR